MFEARCSVCNLSWYCATDALARDVLKKHGCAGAGSVRTVYGFDIALGYATTGAIRRQERIENLLA